MPILIRNPNEAVQPDFASDDYQAARRALVSENTTEEAAIAFLTSAWRANNAAEREMWDRQIREEGQAARDRERHEREEDERRIEVRQEEEQAAKVDEMKKHKSKYTEVSLAPSPAMPPEILPHYVTSRLQKGLYVEMWYFTNEGLDYAVKTSTTVDQNALVQTVDGEGNTVRTTATAFKGVKSTIDDRNLTWEQLMIVILRFLDAIYVAGWMSQRQMMVNLFMRLQAHPYRPSRDSIDRAALLRYLAEQRRLWHQAIEVGTGTWNVGILSKTLLRVANETVWEETKGQRRHGENQTHKHCQISPWDHMPSAPFAISTHTSHFMLKQQLTHSEI